MTEPDRHRETEKENGGECRQPITLMVTPELYRAFYRCVWMVIHETGRSQPEIMAELVTDFLKKHGC